MLYFRAMTPVTQQWKIVETTHAEQPEGMLDMSFQFMEVNTGENYLITISGRAKSDASYWLGALRAATEYVRQQTGQDEPVLTLKTANTLQ